MSKIACVCGVVLTIGHAQAAPQIVYRESFGYCTGSAGRSAADETSWVGLVAGNLKGRISNLKVFSYGLTDIGGAVNSAPQGLSQGYLFWWKPVYGLSLITSEFQFDVGLLKNATTTIEYQQRLSGVDPAQQPNRTHLLIRVDDTWYISSEYVQQIRPAKWESAQVAPAALTYGAVPVVEGRGPQLPESFGVPLPTTGIVRALGLFLGEVNGRVRVDNFVIRAEIPADSGISTDVQEPVVATCPAGSPDLTGGGGQPTPAPDGDDSDSGIDYEIPEAPKPDQDPRTNPISTGTPAPTAVTPIAYEFCPVTQQGAGRGVVISGKARTALLRSISQATLEERRDRALLAILAQRSMPLGAFVNSQVEDFDLVSGAITIVARANKTPVKLKLRAQALQALSSYLASEGAPREGRAPLFPSVTGQGANISRLKAMCVGDLRAMIRARARKAKVTVSGVYTSRARR